MRPEERKKDYKHEVNNKCSTFIKNIINYILKQNIKLLLNVYIESLLTCHKCVLWNLLNETLFLLFP